MKYVVTICMAFQLLASGVFAGDSFDAIKERLARDGCHGFEFLSLIESEVFDQVDSASGVAYISSDGKYHIVAGEDIYLYDLISTYSYSESSGQVIVEKADSAAPAGDGLSFVLNLDRYYETSHLDKNQYRLIRTDSSASEYPDSMIVTIDAAEMMLKQLEYYDVNEELNRIIILKQEYEGECDASRFEPNFPDSAEIIKL